MSRTEKAFHNPGSRQPVRRLIHAMQQVYYGWWIVGVLVLTAAIVSGTSFYCFGVFIEPLMEDFGWSKAQVTWILTVYWIVAAISAPLVGNLMDMVGIKPVMVAASLINGICLLALSQANALWHFYCLYGIKATCHAGIGLIAIGAITSKWFHRMRGRATGIATTGIGFGGLLIAPFAGLLIPTAGWRAVFFILGLFILFFVLPLIALVVKSSPGSLGLLPDGIKQDSVPSATAAGKVHTEFVLAKASGISLRQTLAMPSFWLIAFAFMLASACLFGMLAHQNGYIEGIGISREMASLALGITAGIGILGKVMLGWLAERISISLTTIVCFGMQLVGVGILLLAKNLSLVWVYVIVFGFSMGGLITLRTLILIEFFGATAIGSILGFASLIFAIGPALGPLYAAYIFDATSSYRLTFLVYITIYVAAILLIIAAKKNKPRDTLRSSVL